MNNEHFKYFENSQTNSVLVSEVKWLSGFKALDCLPMESGFAIHSVYIRDVCSTFKIYPVFSRNIPTIYS